MKGLQRSAISFRRQGSSGLVWDDKLISEELNDANKPAAAFQQEQKASAQKAELRRTRSDGGGRRNNYRTVKVEQTKDPPSPRLSVCGFCSVFGRSPGVRIKKRKPGKVMHK